MKLASKSLVKAQSQTDFRGRIIPRATGPTILKVLFPEHGIQSNRALDHRGNFRCKADNCHDDPNIHGFIYSALHGEFMGKGSLQGQLSQCYYPTSANLNKVLTELGATNFKNKKKADKIKLLMNY